MLYLTIEASCNNYGKIRGDHLSAADESFSGGQAVVWESVCLLQGCCMLGISCTTIITDSASNHHLAWPVGRAFDWTQRHICALKHPFLFT